MKVRFLFSFMISTCVFARVQQEGPGMGFPQLSPAQYQEMMSEVDNYLSKMSEEEINTMVQEAMKDPGFQKFVEDVESGKIKPEELFGVNQPMSPVPPTPIAPTKPAPTPATTPPQVPEKPVLAPQRSKTAAIDMIKALIATIGSLRMKAATYHKVGDMLRPWSKILDTFIYYLSAVVDSKKAEHMEQLTGDKNFLPLHDALKRLGDDLRTLEPQVETPEFGERDIAPEVKEKSKYAVQKILGLFQYAFDMQQLIPGLEQLISKYEPELIRRRKTAEEAEQRAVKEAEQAKNIRQSVSRIEREARYVRPAPTFYDWYYEVPEAPRSYYERGEGYQPERERTADLRPGGAGGGAGGKSYVPVAGTKEEKKPEAAKPGKAVSKNIPPRVEPGLAEIEGAAQKIAQILADAYQNTFLGGFGSHAPSYLRAPRPYSPPGGGSAAAIDAHRTAARNKADTFNVAITDITNALAVLQKMRGDVTYEISKMSAGPAKDQANKRLNAAIEQNRALLRPIYDASVALAQQAVASANGQPGSPLTNWFQVPAHFGLPAQPFGADDYQADQPNALGKFQEAYELVYGGDKANREQQDTAMRQAIGLLVGPARRPGPRPAAPAAAGPAPAPARRGRRQPIGPQLRPGLAPGVSPEDMQRMFNAPY